MCPRFCDVGDWRQLCVRQGNRLRTTRQVRIDHVTGTATMLSMPERPRFVVEVIEQARLVGGTSEADVVTRIVEWAEGQRLRPTATPNHPTKGVGYQPVVQGLEGWEPFPIGVYPMTRVVVVEIGHLQNR